MERRSAPLSFSLRIKARLLHELVQRVAERAYRMGHEDGSAGRAENLQRVDVDPSQLRKFQ